MFETFLFSVNAVMPILLLIVLGYIMRRSGLGDGPFYTKLNSICFKIFLPLSLFNNVYSIESLGNVNWAVTGYCVVGVFISFFLGWIGAKFFIKDRKQKGVILQSSFRSNYSIIGLSLAEALGGEPAVAFAAIISAVSIPLYNILAVISLNTYSGKEGDKVDVPKILKATAKNPLILGIFAGLIVLAIRMILPVGADGQPVFMIKNDIPFLYKAMQNAARIASPLMLIILGAQFNFSATSELKKQITLGVILRLVATPVICIGLAVALKNILGLTPVEMPALIAMFGTPVAVSTVVMVAENGADSQLAGQLVVWTSVFSMFSIIILTFMLRTFGLL